MSCGSSMPEEGSFSTFEDAGGIGASDDDSAGLGPVCTSSRWLELLVASLPFADFVDLGSICTSLRFLLLLVDALPFDDFVGLGPVCTFLQWSMKPWFNPKETRCPGQWPQRASALKQEWQYMNPGAERPCLPIALPGNPASPFVSPRKTR